jgi:hypothetical protein
VLPQITVNADGILTGVIGLVGFVLGLHLLLRWFAGTQDWPWQSRWTWGLATLVIVMFAAGIATVGSLHQVGWLVKSPGTLLDRGLRQAAARTTSSNNLKQLGLAALNYEAGHRLLPPGYTTDRWGQPLHGWPTQLLPYMEHDRVFVMVQFDRAWDDPANRPAFTTDIKDYRSPSFDAAADPNGYALTHYAGNSRLLTPNKRYSVGRIRNGASNTILMGEVSAGFRPWGHPLNVRDPARGIRASADAFAGPWADGVTQFIFADGSVRRIKPGVSPEVLKALASPNIVTQINEDDWSAD